MKKIALLFLVMLTTLVLKGQTSNVMEEFMYSSGKIHVVITVILLILLILFIYLFRLEKRLKNMEKDK